MNTNDMTEIEILQKIGARMREIRLEQNMKQKELAEKSGLSMFSISQMTQHFCAEFGTGA